MSKDVPWPGSRCGWMGFTILARTEFFNKLFNTLANAKMMEVCSTTLPQMAIPKIYADLRFPSYRLKENEKIGKRSEVITELLGDLPQLYFNPTEGAFITP